MELIILLVIVGVIAYVVAAGMLDKPARATAEKTKDVAGDLQKRTRRFSWFRSKKQDEFQSWVAGKGAGLFPDEFRTWVAGLSLDQAKDFSKSLDDFSESRGFELTKLVAGGMDAMPARRGVFVEAIVIYSNAYRKLAEAQKKPVSAEQQKSEEQPPDDGKQPVEKAVSRRKADPQPEASAS